MSRAHKIIAAVCDIVAETFWPTRCAGCNLSGELLCEDCRRALPRIEQSGACPRCGAPYGALACTECPPPGALDRDGRLLPPAFPFSAARAVCSYEGVAARLVRIYKDEGELRLAPVIAGLMAEAVRGDGGCEDWAAWADALVRVPPNAANVRRRGYDHLRGIAQELAELLGLPLLECLESGRAKDQRELGREQRAANRRGSLTVAAGASVPPRVLLVDDVLTTGATAAAAAEALLAAGAREVRVAVFARVW